MDAILSNTRYRAIFFSLILLLLIILTVVRYEWLPHLNPALSRSPTEAFGRFAEGLTSSLIVTTLLGLFIFFVTPSVMRIAKIEPVDPKGINPLLREAGLKSMNWTFKGGMGRYTRAETLPALAKLGRKSGMRRKITLMLIDPDNEGACKSYAAYRNGLSSASKASKLTAGLVRDQILATILVAAKTSLMESMVDVTLYVLPIWSVMRVDLSDSYVVITSEDEREPGLRADCGTHFYGTYSKDLDLLAKQGRCLPQLDCLSNLELAKEADLPPLLEKLSLNHADLDAERLGRIWGLAAEKSHQYD